MVESADKRDSGYNGYSMSRRGIASQCGPCISNLHHSPVVGRPTATVLVCINDRNVVSHPFQLNHFPDSVNNNSVDSVNIHCRAAVPKPFSSRDKKVNGTQTSGNR